MQEALNEFQRLVTIMDELRGENGCPWDRDQTFDTLKTFVIEESYELVDTVDDRDYEALCGELGDLQLQIIFMARIAAEEGLFTIADVLHAINEKMIRRHPHVFGSQDVANTDEVLENWEKIKTEERKNGSSPKAGFLSGIPRSLPALQVAYQIGVKTGRVGFDWETPAEVEAKIREEWDEMKEAEASGNHEHLQDELGDLLFTIANFARKHNIDPEDALRRANRKFMRRFSRMEEQVDLHSASPSELEELWNRVKLEENGS